MNCKSTYNMTLKQKLTKVIIKVYINGGHNDNDNNIILMLCNSNEITL